MKLLRDCTKSYSRNRKEVRREYQNRPLVSQVPEEDPYTKDEILDQAFTIMSDVKDKSSILEKQITELENRWKFKHYMK